MTRDISQRKRDHLELAQDESLNFNFSAGFDRWRFIHNALPELNFAEIDTSCTFLRKTLDFPLLISSMSGGTEEAYTFNATLAEAAEQAGCAFGLGSIRAALEQDSARESYLVAREKAPSAVILANLGIAQVIEGNYLDQTAKFCRDCQADGLIIHLNSMQEVFQPEGEPHFKGALSAIEQWVHNFPLPIIIKEVGQGLSKQVIKQLEDIGVEIVDIAGAGGSNWVNIDAARLSEEQSTLKLAASEFADWGEPTAEVLADLQTKLTVIASGGLKRPLDLAKALALGAHLGGVAGALLKPALSGDAVEVLNVLQVWRETLKIAMFGVGVSSIPALSGNRALLQKINYV
ncbi:MAG: type 2 isopentenyl-diphosphate Delta-isomerase [Candidatus Marinimicrobia bacterium]|nr:type 2 isopentenyl-diphosphate Delta-isomerase [Candidatus Neomarinimicrobiota bacterium]